MRLVLLPVLCLLAIGCGNDEPAATAPVNPKTNPAAVLRLEGPGGQIALGDKAEAIDKAFTGFKKGDIPPSPLTLMIPTDESGGLTSPDGKTIVSMLSKDGKVELLVETHPEETDFDKVLADTRAVIGDPTRLGKSGNGGIYVWEQGENARVMANMTIGPKAPAGMYSIVVGPKSTLVAGGLNIDDPNQFLLQLDMAAQLRPVFEEAKKRAKAKMLQRKAAGR